MCSPAPLGCSTGRQPESARKPARATIRGATASAVAGDHACRRAAAPRSGGRRRSRGRPPRRRRRDAPRGQLLGLLVVEAPCPCRKKTTSAAQLAEQQRLVDRHRTARAAPRWPGRAPPSRGSTGSAARRGPTARAAPARPAARRPGPWSRAGGGPARCRRRPGSPRTRRRPPGRRRPRRVSISAAVAAHLRAAASRAARRAACPRGPAGRAPRRRARCAARPRRSPAPTGGTSASISAPLSPAAPPPITTTS